MVNRGESAKLFFQVINRYGNLIIFHARIHSH
jgi:hypothetical protein